MTMSPIHPSDVRVVPDWELCDRLQRSLRQVGLSNVEVADFMGVQPATVSRWINGRNKPARPVLMIWSDMTGVDLAWLETGQASAEALRACRDSNPKPSVWEPRIIQGGKRVKSGLTAFEPCGTYGPTHRRDMGRTLSERLRAVQ